MSASDGTGAAGRDAFARYRERLEGLGFHPSRKLGQNFLLEPAVHQAVADAIDVGAGDLVLEPGPGLGFLTRELCARAEAVVAVEIDTRLQRVLRSELRQAPGGERVHVVDGDVLGSGGLADPVRAAIAERLDGRRFVVASNLPYAISGPFLASMVTDELPPPQAMSLLVQREFAERLAARPATSIWGGPSVLAQSGYAVDVVRRVGKEVFRPRPKVDSAIVRLRRLDDGMVDWPAAERAGFARFVRTIFEARRKTLRHGLRRCQEWVDATFPGLDPSRRAEEYEAAVLAAAWRDREPT